MRNKRIKMNKIIYILILINTLNASETEYFEGRKGFHFGLGVEAIGGCPKGGEWNEEENKIISTKRYCYGLPVLDLELGYNTSNQFEISLDVKTLLFVSLVDIKAKYYMQDAKDTAYVALSGGALRKGNVHSGLIGSYNNIEWGYAYGKKEFSIGLGVPYGDKDIMAHVGYKYVF